jgi:hypothetical protein
MFGASEFSTAVEQIPSCGSSIGKPLRIIIRTVCASALTKCLVVVNLHLQSESGS